MGPFIDTNNWKISTVSSILSDCCTVSATRVISEEEYKRLKSIEQKYYEGNAERQGKKQKEQKLKSYIPKQIIYNGPATIVFWEDGTKTIVKRSKKEKDNKYNAFCAALAKKIYGNNSAVNRVVKSGEEHK